MLPGAPPTRRRRPFLARSSSWVRAPESGILSTTIHLGSAVRAGDLLAVVSDPLGDERVEVRAPVAGVIIGRTLLPLVNEGDAVFHLARFDEPASVAQQLEAYQSDLEPPPAPGEESPT
jgi:predicted deacylase